MKSKWALAVVVGLIGLAVYAGNALATPGSGFTVIQEYKGVFDEMDVHFNDMPRHQVKLSTKGLSDVHVVRNSFNPGGHTGWHTHPAESLIIVTLGTITAYDGDDPTCTGTVYKAGEGFVHPGDGRVHLLRNETNAAAETVAVQIFAKGATRRIDITPAPVNCPF